MPSWRLTTTTKDLLLIQALRRRVWDASGPELTVLKKIDAPRSRPSTAAAPRKAAPTVRKATPAARPAAAATKAHQGDDGSSLMAARRYADNVRLKARILAHAQNGNASPSEIAFCKLAAKLPRRRPTEANPLREWRAYAAAVESLKAAINKTKVTF